MSLIAIILVIVIVGVLMWFINTYIPMARPIKTILNVVVVLALIIWVLSAFGLISGFGNMGNMKLH